MSDPWEPWNEVASLEPSDVPEECRHLYAIGWLRTEVNSDGFLGFLFNLSGTVVPDAATAARSNGRQDLAELIERAMALAGDPYPADIAERRRVLGEMSDAEGEQFHALDLAYWDLEERDSLDDLMRSLANRS